MKRYELIGFAVVLCSLSVWIAGCASRGGGHHSSCEGGNCDHSVGERGHDTSELMYDHTPSHQSYSPAAGSYSSSGGSGTRAPSYGGSGSR